MMTSDLASSYPTGEHLEGNFITYYTTHYTYFDRFIVKLFGERGIEVDKDEPLTDTVINWTYDVNAIVFTHLVDWAKMYSASIKDYEPLWNVDGTVETHYGPTKETDLFGGTSESTQYGATKLTDEYGATSESTQYGATSESMQYGNTSESTQYGGRSETIGQRTDTGTDYKTSYPDGTEVKTDKHTDDVGAQTNTTQSYTDTTTGNAHTDTKTGTTHTDTITGTAHTDNHSTIAHTDTTTGTAHTDEHSAIAHTDTERRTGNIGVTKSTDLVESEYRLRERWNFYRLIFGYIVREMGCIYYDWY